MRAVTGADPSRLLLEACVTDPEEAVAAAAGGAERLELCRALEVGGLTPATSLLDAVRRGLEGAGLARVEIVCMVRPAPGPFVAPPDTVARMRREIRGLRGAGAQGVVLGALTGAHRVDLEALRDLLDAAAELPVTFHRAFDQVPDPLEALEILGDEGVRRILTAGGPGTAWEGRETLRRLVEASRSPGKPVILGGGGIRAGHAPALLRATGLREIHARASAYPALARTLKGS